MNISGTGLGNLIGTMIAAFAMLTIEAVMAAPDLISYQGRLTDSTGVNVADSTYDIVLTIHTDSVGGSLLWQESATVVTQDGLFSHLLGSVSTINQSLFQEYDRLFLGISVGGETPLPRIRLTSVPYAKTAGNLNVEGTGDEVAIKTVASSHQLTIYGFTGQPSITLKGGIIGDNAVVLPDSSISSAEILDEPGIVVEANAALIPLSTISMTDLATVDITIPNDGYIVLHGKCYLLLSGTTGANSAHVQIDENAGGSSLFPYYTVAGLAGYVNTGTNYFPVYATRTYFKQAGTYSFRMEGRAVDPSPAVAKTWDHIFTAVYYPTGYGAVKSISMEPDNRAPSLPITITGGQELGRTGTYYVTDLRYYERESKTSGKSSAGPEKH